MLSRDSRNRYILILMLVAILLTVTACSRKDNGVSPTLSSSPQSSPLESTMPKLPLSISASCYNDTIGWGPNLSPLAGIDYGWNWSRIINYGGNIFSALGGRQIFFFTGNPTTGFGTGTFRLIWPQPQKVGCVAVILPRNPNGPVKFTVSLNIPDQGWVTIPDTEGATRISSQEYERAFPAATASELLLEVTGNYSVEIYRIEAMGPHKGRLEFGTPFEGSVFEEGSPVTFTGGMMWHSFFGKPSSLSMSSNLDGSIGEMSQTDYVGVLNYTSLSCSNSHLSVGTHTISISATNTIGEPISVSRTIYIVPKPGGVKITSPLPNTEFSSGEEIHFSSSADFPLLNYLWTCDGVALGTSPGNPDTSASYLSPGTHTIKISAQRSSDLSLVSDSIAIFIADIVQIKIKNLEAQPGEDPFAPSIAVSYRAAKTRFEAIGCRQDGSEIGPVPVKWSLDGGDVSASTEPIRQGILNQLKLTDPHVLNNKIGTIDGKTTVNNAQSVTFYSYLPSHTDEFMTLTATSGSHSATKKIRTKQPCFGVVVWPVSGAGNVDIFEDWKSFASQSWQTESIIRIQTFSLNEAISNVAYPNSPLDPPMIGAEEKLASHGWQTPSFLNPILYDLILAASSSCCILPRQPHHIFSKRASGMINVYVVKQTLCYEIPAITPYSLMPIPDFVRKSGMGVSADEYFDFNSRLKISDLGKSGVSITNVLCPSFTTEHKRCLAHEIGHLLIQNGEEHKNMIDNPISNLMTPEGQGIELNSMQLHRVLRYSETTPNSLLWEE